MRPPNRCIDVASLAPEDAAGLARRPPAGCLCEHRPSAPGAADGLSIGDLEFAGFQRLIFSLAGITLSGAKKNFLIGRLARRLRHYGFATYAEYLRLVGPGGDPAERQTMVDLLTTNETYFFREGKHFDFLRSRVLPMHPPGREFSAWSAACSSGEEVYTIAIVLAETLGLARAWTITGSDISRSVLQMAASGHYPMERSRGMPPEYLRKYCLKGIDGQAGTFLIDRRLRQHTRFLAVNLNAALPEIGPFDVIFLRNVMIYFDPPTKRQVVERLARKLHPGGYLLIGHSETLNGINDSLEPVQPTVYRRP